MLLTGGENRNHFRRATVQNGDYLKVIKAWKMIFQSHAVSLVCELIEYSIINLEISFRSPRAQNAAQEKQENELPEHQQRFQGKLLFRVTLLRQVDRETPGIKIHSTPIDQQCSPGANKQHQVEPPESLHAIGISGIR
ncbi:hypothetical protein OWV82_020778 [Melia azedarach]|uniref:Uncharacterized protein n=1 Tax=Melia azedarach TaxID=155640 RepID=A0ACC1X702_MELAZ|nr:hypothetical protein OWV82_020778 [Melia azedarach]